MRLLTGLIASVAVIGCAIAAEPAQQPQQPNTPPAAGGADKAAPAAPGGSLSADSTVDQILDALDARGQNLKAFSADVSLTEGDATLGNTVTRHGKVLYQDRGGDGQGGPRLRVVFDTRDTGTRVFDEKVEYLLADGWLTDRTYAKRIQVRRQVLRPGEKVDLLKLGEGPFPLPIGQKKEDVYEQFDAKKAPPAKDDPPGTVHVQLTPKPGTQFERKFDVIDVWVDLKTNMPARIDTPQGETVRSTELKNFTVNPEPPLTDKDFALPPIKAGEWDMHEEPFNE
jgi:outer membrane lipoprotein-sorting protein